MTYKQGQEINSKFLNLTDSIKFLSKNLKDNNYTISNLKIEKNKIDSALLYTSYKLTTSEKEIKKMEDSIKNREKIYWRERREWAIWMVFLMAVTIIVSNSN